MYREKKNCTWHWPRRGAHEHTEGPNHFFLVTANSYYILLNIRAVYDIAFFLFKFNNTIVKVFKLKQKKKNVRDAHCPLKIGRVIDFASSRSTPIKQYNIVM